VQRRTDRFFWPASVLDAEAERFRKRTSALRQQAAIDCAEDQGEIDKHTSMSMYP
jgi:hypothetical protein